MIVAVDVDYRSEASVTACVGIRDWSDATPCLERVVRTTEAPAPYVPGEFYLREMPRIAEVLERIPQIDVLIVDGYVWLAAGRPGLGAHLYERLGRRCPVVGVAKTPFRGNDCACPVERGASKRPLYVTAIGIDALAAAEGVARMHGAHRIPTILKYVDRLAREA